jgi:hypothetical protein
VIARGRKESRPTPSSWRTAVERGQDEALIFAALPGFSVQLATI